MDILFTLIFGALTFSIGAYLGTMWTLQNLKETQSEHENHR